ncbi:MAG TPA: 4-hydroxy-3-methylbut-2-enyl diphosphate reductase [Candidatus Brocadiia bacterium]|nr:4-hydroxy-3-methylbut-2-enyl diphosphate reductase [Candidatus Brocadiales bacterium]
MRVIVAKTAGFCMGVKKAMDIVLDAAHDKNTNGTVYTDGPLIHNPQVLDLLRQKGIGVAQDSSDLSRSTVVIRAHGITPARRMQIEQQGAKICDATCPHVKRVQRIISKYARQGYSTVIVGDKGHAEVIGLLGYAEGRGYVVEVPDDVDKLPAMQKVCVVAQTTQESRMFEKTTEKLKKRYGSCEIFGTVCSSTSERQEEVINLSKSVDAMIVVGGRGSANTNRLVKISEAEGKPTFHIETENELNPKMFREFEVIGVTAGASTPNWLITRVVEKLESCQSGRFGKLQKHLKDVAMYFVGSNAYASIGAACLTYANCLIMGIQPKAIYGAISALSLFSALALDHFANKEADTLNEPFRAFFYEKRQSLIIGLGIFGAVLSMTLSFLVSPYVFLLVFFTSLSGMAYRLEIIPKKLPNIIYYRSLKQIQGSKEIFFSVALAVYTALIPFLGSGSYHFLSLIVAFVFTFCIVFIRAVLLDMRDIQGDMLMGKETIPIAIGKEKTKIILWSMAVLLAVFLVITPVIGWASYIGFYMVTCLIYACSYLYLYHRRILADGLICEFVVDFGFILAGISAFVGKNLFVVQW